MRKIQDIDELERRIKELETLKEIQKKDIKLIFRDVAHQLNPVTMIKNGMHTVVGTPGLGTSALGTAVSTSAGYISKKMVINKSHNLFRNIAGMVVEFIVVNIVRNKIPLFRGKAHAAKNGSK